MLVSMQGPQPRRLKLLKVGQTLVVVAQLEELLLQPLVVAVMGIIAAVEMQVMRCLRTAFSYFATKKYSIRIWIYVRLSISFGKVLRILPFIIDHFLNDLRVYFSSLLRIKGADGGHKAQGGKFVENFVVIFYAFQAFK